jgi:enoyl-CoA hydratase/carnithine racemase
VGRAKALEWILTGDNIAPKDAEAVGLVNHVVPEAELLRQVQGFAKKVAMQPMTALRQALIAVRDGIQEPNLETAMKVELEAFGKCCESSDMKEGIASFIEKRQPKFTDQ